MCYTSVVTIPLNSPEVRTWLIFLRAHAAILRRMEKGVQDAHGISLVWVDVLTQLSLEDNQRMTHARLSQRVLVSVSGLTRIIDGMTKAGLVVRRASRRDRRASYVVLTEEGMRKLEEVRPTVFRDVEENFIQYLRPEETPVLYGFLKRVMDED
ncbi:MAG: winged helix-turn-helix transcriptional regulator [Chloroflexi bacterium]|nr:winged helix-turn-helix transcriptional regulator [Chloroflexota bacterium]